MLLGKTKGVLFIEISSFWCIYLVVASAPTDVTAVQESPTSILVCWSPPDPMGNITGYRIYYTNDVNTGSADVSGGSTDSHTLTGLQNGVTYTISIVATSSQSLPSEIATADKTVGLSKLIY